MSKLLFSVVVVGVFLWANAGFRLNRLEIGVSVVVDLYLKVFRLNIGGSPLLM